MKTVKKPNAITSGKTPASSGARPRANSIRLTVVSESERNQYRVPSYGYII